MTGTSPERRFSEFVYVFGYCLCTQCTNRNSTLSTTKRNCSCINCNSTTDKLENGQKWTPQRNPQRCRCRSICLWKRQSQKETAASQTGRALVWCKCLRTHFAADTPVQIVGQQHLHVCRRSVRSVLRNRHRVHSVSE